MKKRSVFLILFPTLLVIFIGVRLISAKNKWQKNNYSDKKEIKYVRTKTVKNETIPVLIEIQGRVNSFYQVALLAEVQGKLLKGEKIFKEGDSFKKGDLLFSIYLNDAAFGLQARKSTFLTKLAMVLADIKVDYPEHYNSWNTFFNAIELEKSLPQLPDLGKDKFKVFLSARGVLTDYYTVKSEEERLTKYRIYAPFDGVITAQYSEIGGMVNPGSKIADVIADNSLEIQSPVTVLDAPFIKIGQTAKVSSQEGVVLGEAIVSRIGKQLNTTTQSVDMYLNFSGDRLMEGMYIQLTFDKEFVANAMEIPRRALMDESLVYVVKDSLLKTTTVKIEKFIKDNVIISGLQEGQRVVTEPLMNVNEFTIVAPL